MWINGYPFPNFVLLLLFFLLMWFDRKIMAKGGWFFYINKIAALFSIFGSFVLVNFSFYSWTLASFVFFYAASAYLVVRKSY